MRKIIIFILSISLSFSAIAQKEKKQKNNNFQIDTSSVNEFEIDITNILKTTVFISDFGGGTRIIGSPYILTYRRYIGEWDVHTGFGLIGDIDNSVRNDTINRKSSSLNFNYGIGFTHYTSIGKKFKLFYGSDVVYNLSNSKSEYDGDDYYDGEFIQKNKSITHSGGLSPFLGIQFYLHPRISLSTETSFNISSFKGTEESERVYEDTNLESTNSSSTTSGLNANYTLPLNIKLRVRF